MIDRPVSSLPCAPSAVDTLRESEERFRAFVTASSDVVYLMGPDWKEMRQLAGREFLPDTPSATRSWNERYIPADERERVQGVIDRCIQTKSIFELEHKVLRVDGSIGWVSSRAVPILGADGSIREWVGTARDITARKEADLAARRLDDTFGELIERAPFGIYVVNADFRIAHMNAGSQQGAFRNVRPVLGRDFGDAMRILWPEPVAAEIISVFRRTLETGEPYYSRNFVQPRNDVGDTEAYEWELHRLELPDGRFGVTCYYFDSTELRKAETKLRSATEQLLLISNAVPALISYIDADFRYQFCNRAYTEWFGVRCEDIIGRKVVEVLGEEAWGVVGPRMEAALRGEVSDFEAEVSYKAGGRRWIHAIYTPHRDQENRLVGLVIMVADITRRKRAEEGLRESEMRFRQLAESMPQLVWTADDAGQVDYYNHLVGRYAREARCASGELSWEKLIHPADLAATTAAWQKAAASKAPYQHEHRLRMADGTYRWHLSRAFRGQDTTNGGAKWFGTATDIDEQRRAQEILERTVQQRTARLSEAVSELEAFSYSIAHDMRAPLRGMHGFADMLESDYGQLLDETGKMYVERISSSATRLDALINDVLNYSRVSRGEAELTLIDCDKLLREIIATYRHLQPPAAVIEIEGPLPPVRGFLAGLTQCFSNILGNAVKFVGPGVQPRVRVYSQRFEGTVRLWFEDNGIGIPAAEQHKLFRIFQRLHSPAEFEGTGIGLAIVRKAIERMNGTVGVESEPGRGSRFWLEIPN